MDILISLVCVCVCLVGMCDVQHKVVAHITHTPICTHMNVHHMCFDTHTHTLHTTHSNTHTHYTHILHTHAHNTPIHTWTPSTSDSMTRDDVNTSMAWRKIVTLNTTIGEAGKFRVLREDIMMM